MAHEKIGEKHGVPSLSHPGALSLWYRKRGRYARLKGHLTRMQTLPLPFVFQDELAHVLVTLFDDRQMLPQLLNNLFAMEVCSCTKSLSTLSTVWLEIKRGIIASCKCKENRRLHRKRSQTSNGIRNPPYLKSFSSSCNANSLK